MALQDRSRIRLLIVDDEEDFREAAVTYFSKLGYEVNAAADGQSALELIRSRSFNVAVVDLHMPKLNGIDLLRQLRDEESELQAIMLTGGGTIEHAVESMKNGAFDFLTKPARLNELDLLIQKAFRAHDLEKENRQLREVLKQSTPPSSMVGDSPAMQAVYRLIDKTASTQKPVLIEGASGTGKELVARAIHARSALADHPLVVINCAALPDNLLESELFGYEKGAFTGAVGPKQGLFEVADGGTLFVDEIGELALPLQAKLLRVVEDGTFRRVGSVKERRANVRLIAATNRDLAAEVEAKRFREDLFYRINLLTIRLPSLAERPGDIRLLVRHFLGDDWEISDALLEQLTRFDWPGNVRQLQNALERAKILSEDHWIVAENLPPEVVATAPLTVETGGNHSAQLERAGSDLESVNRRHVLSVYEDHGRNKSRTARALGIGRRSLYRLLEKYGID